MNADNLSALAVGIGVVMLIAGFGVYFNSPELNKAASSQQKSFVPAAIVEDNGTITRVQIDKSQFKQAPELTKITGYINSEPITLADLRGRVVLVDFWTYSCINCIRTIPYLNAWHEKYADDGLVIVGVHTPEFEFEKHYNNVKGAVERFGINYPVVQDNEKQTWNAYENRYWPRKYLIDSEGYIRYDHIGEGAYAETEKVIQSLLAERTEYSGGGNITIDQSISNPESAQNVNFGRINTPELYFGYQYAREPLGNSEGYKPDQIVKYTIPDDTNNIAPNRIYLAGEWKNNADHMELQSEVGQIVLSYSAKAVNIVAGGSGNLRILEDNSHPDDDRSRGTDVSEDNTVKIDGQRLYNVMMHEEYGDHQIAIDVVGRGFQIYTFTFG
jgi:thiol-disulfide isomerase/thioredoxin